MTAAQRALGFALLTLAALGCGGGRSPEPILVGHIAPLTGPHHTLGEQARQGVALAVADLKNQGANVGGRPFAVVHADEQGEGDVIGAETVRLVSINKVVGLIGAPGATTADRLLRADAPYGVAVVLPTQRPPGASAGGSLALGVPAPDRGRALARHAVRDPKVKKVIVLTDSRNTIASALATAFVRQWPGDRGEVTQWSFATEAERKGLLERSARARPDFVLVAASGEDFLALAKGLTTPTLAYGGEDRDAATLAHELEGGPRVIHATAWCTDKLPARGEEVVRRFEEQFRQRPGLEAAQAYDATQLLFGAIQRAQSTAVERVREELLRTESYEALTGSVTWKDGQARRDFFLVRLEAGKAQLMEPVKAE